MRKILMLILMIATVFSLTVGAYATDLSVASMTDDIREGDTFTVTVKYSDTQLDSVKGSLEYDDEVLKYVSGGSSSGNGGTVKLDGYSDDAATITFDIMFEAIKSGTAEITAKTSECYDLSGAELSCPEGTASVEISKLPKEEQKEEQVAEPEPEPEVEVDEPQDYNAEIDDIKQQSSNTKMLIGGVAITLVILIAVIAIVRPRKRK